MVAQGRLSGQRVVRASTMRFAEQRWTVNTAATSKIPVHAYQIQLLTMQSGCCGANAEHHISNGHSSILLLVERKGQLRQEEPVLGEFAILPTQAPSAFLAGLNTACPNAPSFSVRLPRAFAIEGAPWIDLSLPMGFQPAEGLLLRNFLSRTKPVLKLRGGLPRADVCFQLLESSRCASSRLVTAASGGGLHRYPSVARRQIFAGLTGSWAAASEIPSVRRDH